MKGLCQRCYESNVTLTLCRGVPKCADCFEFDQCHEKAVKKHEQNK
jgi:hypothetical protein